MLGDRQRKILIVDDDLLIVEVLRERLEEEGYLTFGAANGKEALELLKADPLPDLILLDLSMPEMDGEVFRKLQLEDPRLAPITVILISGFWQDLPDVFNGLAARFNKPVSLPVLLEKVNELLCDEPPGSSL